ncbi:LRR receptor-like serine/threonine-protein kinase RGI3 [Magnolia sinica]|uniref:LRR receptor-like serine/threonine-protein kinase RGI3 n=1 Tax=Magnolia sinica TaxID=86752 RepID=UPI002657D541|nr:LRR receptor-like serine/threonine-protein kinase RGI3 [Magnolia sinica]
MPPNPNTFSSSLLLSVFSLLSISCFSIDEQGLALLSWKNSLSPSTDAFKTWNPLDPNPCNWFGIVCNSNLEVARISLQSIDLRGSLPSNFQSLKSLEYLVLTATNLTGPIPKEFGEYAELVFIDLSNNAISGEIPVEICTLSKLESLYLNSNMLEGGIPLDIGNLSSLLHLTLFDNHLSGEIPKSIGSLRKLEVFRAGGNQNLKGELPLEIGNCSNLVMLGLAETGISGSLPPSIGQLKRIQTIKIYTAFLSGPIPEELGNCTNLQNLYLYQNSISGPIPTQLGKLRKLQNLLLWQNSLVGTIPFELGSCRELTVVDLSINLLSGRIPKSLGNISNLQGLQLSVNQISGPIPPEILNCTALTHLEVDNNDISGEIPNEFGKLKNLTLFFAWQNKLTGSLPDSLAECGNLQALDLSCNNLSGPIPKQIFELQNLTKLLLISNDLSGFLLPEIGNCTNLFRFRVSNNRLVGPIPAEIGSLKNLNFLDLGSNRLVGQIPPLISGCDNLQFLDLHSNAIVGSLPETLPKSLQVIDASDNRLSGPLTPSLGALAQLTKLVLGRNRLSGRIPAELRSCSKLQLLDLGDNSFSGEIPPELGQIPALEISLNLSCNQLSGEIPLHFSGLDKLGILDLSHNELTGSVDVLTTLQNLVALNISYNGFSGELPDTPFFRKLPLSDLAGNHGLYIPGRVGPDIHVGPTREATTALKLAMSVLVSASAVVLLLALYMLVRARVGHNGGLPADDAWEMTLYQKLNFSVDDVVRNLTSANVIGTGSSGVVYRVAVPNGPMLAVKRMWSSEASGAFQSEIQALGSIRHRNIVRLLGWCANNSTKLLFYDYHPNGSLSALLHGAGGKCVAEWEMRYEILLGVGHALAYMHHDCVPAIMHGDVKAMNVLLGPMFEPYLADFGLARTVNGGDDSSKLDSRASTHIAGSYGYMAPEYASMQRITEMSDVYSYGVVLLEVLTGRHPLDPSLPGGAHLVQWIRDHLQSKRDPFDVLDSRLRGRPDSIIQEMLQALALAVLCISNRPNDRPTMKDVVALLKEIRRMEIEQRLEADASKGESTAVGSPTAKRMVLQGSSNCSFAFSNSSSY